MAIAPSEKHLEDWIVDHLGFFGTFWKVEETQGWPEGMCIPFDDELVVASFFKKVLRRQMRFPFGRADLICEHLGTIAAVEIKKGLITAHTVVQCARYMHELRQIWAEVMYFVSAMPEPERSTYNFTHLYQIDVTTYPSSEISGMVVGHEVSDPNLLVVCALCNIQVVTYEYDGDSYTFETHEAQYERHQMQSYKDCVKGAIGQAMLNLMRETTEWQRAHESERSSQSKLFGREVPPKETRST